MTDMTKFNPVTAAEAAYVRKSALDLLKSARRDPDAWRPRETRLTDEPHRSAWRTFQLAAAMAARLSARNLLWGNPENAMMWAKVFAIHDAHMNRALSIPMKALKAGERS